MLKRIKLLPKALKEGLRILQDGNPLILASSTAFFTTFSLAPILMILVGVLGLYFKGEVVSKKLFENVKLTLGEQSARQIEMIVKNFQMLEGNFWFTIGGFIFFTFVATTLLLVIQQSIHILWHITVKSSINWRINFFDRMKALVLILVLGLVFLASQLLDASILFLFNFLHQTFPSVGDIHFRVLNICISLIVVVLWITILLRYLPDARVHGEVALAGGVLTGVLYMLGKFVLHKFLIQGNIASIFGASASFALILLFIFYSSFIVYYGASFTYAYGIMVKKPVMPGKYTESYIEKVVQLEDPIDKSL